MGDNVIKLPSQKIWHAKIRRFAETFWVKIDGEEYGTLWGSIANNLITPRLKHGDSICFERAEIIEEQNPHVIKSKCHD